jgi:integrase
MFRQAKRWGVVEVNVASDLEKPKEPRPRSRAFTVDEYSKVEAGLVPDEQKIARMALATAQSLGDVTGLEWGCVDLDGGSIYFHRQKSDETYHIGISDESRDVLSWAKDRRKKLAKLTGQFPRIVFVDSSGQDYNSLRRRNMISKHFKAACRRAGVQWGSFKALRTTAATWADEDGAPIESVQKALGHADIRTTQRFYVRAGVRSQVKKTHATLSAVSRRLSDSGPESAPSAPSDDTDRSASKKTAL